MDTSTTATLQVINRIDQLAYTIRKISYQLSQAEKELYAIQKELYESRGGERL